MSIYIIDNDGIYSSHRIYFVEADPSVMDELLVLMAKAFPRVCQRCGKSNIHDLGWCGPPREQIRHYRRRFSFLMAKADKVDWFEGKPQTIAEWLDSIECSLNNHYDRDDKQAAQKLGQMVRQLAPGVYLDSEYYPLKDEK